MRMIKVLLADDEPVIIRGLKLLISWEEMGLEIVGEASNGIELRAMIDQLSPDLVISDISMPGFTGIDIIRELSVENRPVKTIFISAYQEFSYARDAVKYGAVDYLLKPVNKLQLEQVLQKAKSLIQAESEGALNRAKLIQYEQRDRTHTIEEWLDRLTDGEVIAAQTLLKLGVLAVSRYTTVCVAEIEWTPAAPRSWEERERRLVEFAIKNVISEALDERGNGRLFRKGERYSIVIQHERLEEPNEIITELHRKVGSYLKIQLTIGIGRSVTDLAHTADSYCSALERLKLNYFGYVGQVIPFKSNVTDLSRRHQLEELQSRLIHELVNLTDDAEQLLARELLMSIRMLSEGNRTKAVSMVYAVLMHVEQELKKVDIPIRSSSSDDRPLLERLGSYPYFAEVEADFINAIGSYRKTIAEKMDNRELSQLTKIKGYIEENYDKNITLESLSALVFMNPYYFSSFFKKHIGQNYKAYITDVRLKHALRLLIQSDLRVYEISDRVGYKNTRHFSLLFKKKFGKLPQDYKQTPKEG